MEAGAATQLFGLLTRRRSSATTPTDSNNASRRSSTTDGQAAAAATSAATSAGSSAAAAGPHSKFCHVSYTEFPLRWCLLMLVLFNRFVCMLQLLALFQST